VETRQFKALGICLSLFCGTASGDVIVRLGFTGLTDNNAEDVETGQAQLSVDVGNDIGGGLRANQVRFRFHNDGDKPCSITDIYFDDGQLLGIAFLENTEGLVEFSQGAAPPNLPGGELAAPPFETTAGFSADSDPPILPLGINPGENLGIIFDIQPGYDRFDVVDELADESLRIGIHVQGFASGGSESFLNVPTPEPATLGLMLLVAPFLRRRGV
jgi:hypothetical protein